MIYSTNINNAVCLDHYLQQSCDNFLIIQVTMSLIETQHLFIYFLRGVYTNSMFTLAETWQA